MRWTDAELVSTIFHELAHQRLYIKGDTAFNESFATAVADIGMMRWLDERAEVASIGVFRKNRELRQSLMTLVEATKTDLRNLYGSDLDVPLMRTRKQELLDDLSAAAANLIEAGGSGATNWLAPPLNNARLASLGLYEGRQGVFNAILRDCNEELDCFYAEAEKLAELDQDERKRRMDQMAD